MVSMNENRLIGDFLEVNADIAYNESQLKKYNFIKRYRLKQQRKELKTILDKFANSDYILTRDNLYELFVYLWNNADIYKTNADKHKSISIFKPEITEEGNNEDDRIEGVILLDKIHCLIHMDSRNKNMEISLEYYNEDNTKSGSRIERERLYDKNASVAANEVLLEINKFLIDTIRDYILFNINRFDNTEE